MVLAATTGIGIANIWRAESERRKGRFYNVVGSEEGLTCDCQTLRIEERSASTRT